MALAVSFFRQCRRQCQLRRAGPGPLSQAITVLSSWQGLSVCSGCSAQEDVKSETPPMLYASGLHLFASIKVFCHQIWSPREVDVNIAHGQPPERIVLYQAESLRAWDYKILVAGTYTIADSLGCVISLGRVTSSCFRARMSVKWLLNLRPSTS